MAKRRGNDEGAIYQRPNGKWQAQVSLDGKRLSKTFGTQKDCRTWIKDISEQKDRGLNYDVAKLTLAEYLSSWLDDCRSQVKPNTWLQYEGVVRNHIRPELGEVILTELKPPHIQHLYTRKLQSGISTMTVRLIHAVLHRALVVAHRQGYIQNNPANAVQKPAKRSKEMKVLNDHQVREFLIALRGNRLESLYFLAITSGMRQGELLALTWNDLDWGTGLLHISRQVQRIPGEGLVFTPPKTRAGNRTIDLGLETLEQLEIQKKRQRVEKRLAGAQWRENDLMFTSTIGTVLDQRNLYRSFKIALREAGLPDIRFHDLRHTAASLMLMSGVPPIKVSQRLGHSKTSVTLDIYGHFIPSMRSEAGLLMDQLVTPIAADLQQQKEHAD